MNILLWCCTMLFYMYQYLLRAAPSAMHHAWVAEFHITATEFASIGAIYLYAYGCLQIPVGWLLDRIGIRRILLASLAMCLSGAFLLAEADSFGMIQLSRLAMGIGSAVPFICAMKIIQDQFAKDRQPFFSGFTLTMGIIGAMCAGLPLQLLVEHAGWRMASKDLAMMGLVIFLLIAFLTRRWQRMSISATPKCFWSQVNGPVILYAIITIGLYAPLSVLVDIWGVPFLSLKYGISREQAASITMLGYLGLAIGSSLLPLLVGSAMALHRVILASLGVVGTLLGMIVLAHVSVFVLPFLFLTLGFFCGSLMLCYPAIGTYTTSSNSGFIFGVANACLMLGEGMLNFCVGLVMDGTAQGSLNLLGEPVYTTSDYQLALAAVLLPVVAASVACVGVLIGKQRKQASLMI